MEILEARDIIQALADGVDPETDRIIHEDSLYNRPRVIHALCVTLQVLEKEVARTKKRRDVPSQAGQPWNADEDRLLAEAFDRGASVRTLAKIHERTEGAISSRLMRLGKIQKRP